MCPRRLRQTVHWTARSAHRPARNAPPRLFWHPHPARAPAPAVSVPPAPKSALQTCLPVRNRQRLDDSPKCARLLLAFPAQTVAVLPPMMLADGWCTLPPLSCRSPAMPFDCLRLLPFQMRRVSVPHLLRKNPPHTPRGDRSAPAPAPASASDSLQAALAFSDSFYRPP